MFHIPCRRRSRRGQYRSDARIAARGGCEALEDRTLLAIVWANRGAGDGFDTVFGASAGAARDVVDAAVAAWDRVITNFNFQSAPLDNTIRIDFLATTASGVGASATHDRNQNGQIDVTEVDAQGRPRSGLIRFNSGITTENPNGWYLDATPNDSVEFMANIDNAFSGDATFGGPAFNRPDFFTVAVLEMTHILGLSGGQYLRFHSNPLYTPTGVIDPNDGLTGGTAMLYAFDGPSVDALLTGLNGGGDFNQPVHTAEPNAAAAGLVGSNDTGNAFYEFGRRYLPSNLDALILQDAYGYNITMPERFGTFYSVLNPATRELTVRGSAGADNVDASLSEGQLILSVDVGLDVPGTGPTDAFVSVYDPAAVGSIVVDVGDGDDFVRIGNLISDPVRLYGGGGIDDMDGGAGPDDIYGGDGNDILSGAAGGDLVDGEGGDDSVHGGNGADLVVGGQGNDTLWGDDQDDEIWGDDLGQEANDGYGYGYGGNDECHGGDGEDDVHGGPGSDHLIGGPGSDWLYSRDGEPDTLEGGLADWDRAIADGFDSQLDIEENL